MLPFRAKWRYIENDRTFNTVFSGENLQKTASTLDFVANCCLTRNNDHLVRTIFVRPLGYTEYNVQNPGKATRHNTRYAFNWDSVTFLDDILIFLYRNCAINYFRTIFQLLLELSTSLCFSQWFLGYIGSKQRVGLCLWFGTANF